MLRAAHPVISCDYTTCGRPFVTCCDLKQHQQYQWLGILPLNPGESDIFYKLPADHYDWLVLAKGHLTQCLFGAMAQRIAALPVPGYASLQYDGFSIMSLDEYTLM
jgi:hypothetical protein